MSTVAKETRISSVGMTPNPVNAASVYLIQIGASEVAHTWGDWASSTWSALASLKWGE